MRNLIILLVCVPLQFALISYRTPAEKYLFSGVEFLRNKIKDYVSSWTGEYLKKAEPEVDENMEDEVAVRIHRPPQLKYRVGQVVVNTKLAYLGIVIGWSIKESEPVYELLTDHPAVPEYKTKSVQSELLRMEHIQLHHEEAGKYFETFDSDKSQFVPKPWLRLIYPTD